MKKGLATSIRRLFSYNLTSQWNLPVYAGLSNTNIDDKIVLVNPRAKFSRRRNYRT